MENYLRICLAFCLVAFSSPGVTIEQRTRPIIKLNVIADHGGESASRYINTKTIEVKPIDYRDTRIEGSMLKNMLPIRTPEMSPGRLRQSHLKRDYAAMSFPVFVIGNDGLSRQWLADNAQYLKKHKAIGLLIQLDTMTEYDEIKRLGDGLPIIPTYGAQMGQQLQLDRYPFYVDQTGVHQ